MNHDAIIHLKAAVGFSPDKIGLRLMLARALMDEKQFAAAEAEYNEVIAVDPHHTGAKGGLIKACIAQQKHSMAFVILEEICGESATPGEYHALYAAALVREDRLDEAKEQYRLAVRKGHSLKFGEVEYLFG
jgi:transitional endoplasmic reticulum ATPase